MQTRVRTAVLLSLLLACQHAGTPASEGRVLTGGGELADVGLADKTVRVSNTAVTVWGVIEVPDGSRLQAAYAGVDAVARSELLKLVRVRIADVVVSIDSTDPARRAAYEHTVEVVGGVIRHAGMTRHGWERVQRGSQVILRVWARLTVPRAQLDDALNAASRAGELSIPANLLDALSATENAR